MKKIIIVEDDQVIREELEIFLRKYGYDPKAMDSFENPVEEIKKEMPDLILLDINLPYYDGYHICRELRKTIDTPIVVVTSRDSEGDELMSMNLGADDFITKPYNTQILLARIAAILQRSQKQMQQQEMIHHDGLQLNLSTAVLSYENSQVELTKNEIRILSYLLNNVGKIVSRETLMEYLWSTDSFVDDAALSVNITRLRKKLTEVGKEGIIETKRKMGYLIQ
ncbi:response regulator transcription factor [Tindallia californiensis]|uniref:Stage 0 sporulation protein A homolog n=1 Tax=Tindallia californiensis TaxID=159292 RepID=A0A1H3P7K9_9FIRM|nr:response regulator transcription factor [Tindallia californiensis]SDY96953.1 DNA-binding response regulator, OmpR family, contains REC and winged-helix (wHTH) domain [Tindallia californiensis]